MDRDELSKVGSMEAMREAWTDDRLDDLAIRTDRGFDRVDKDVREVRAEMKAGFDRVDDEFREVRGEMKAGFQKMEARTEARFDALHGALHDLHGALHDLQRTMLQIGGGLIGTLLVVTAGILASRL